MRWFAKWLQPLGFGASPQVCPEQSVHSSPGLKRCAVAEAAEVSAEPTEAESRQQGEASTSGSGEGTPRIAARLHGQLGKVQSMEPVRRQLSSGEAAPPALPSRGSVPHLALALRTGSGVRFADVSDLRPKSAMKRDDRDTDRESKPRVRMAAPSEAGSAHSVISMANSAFAPSEADRDGTASATPSTTTGRASETESRALTQLASKLIAKDVNYRSEFEAIMDDFGCNYPKRCLELFFERHEIVLPGQRNATLMVLYQAQDDEDKVDGIRLLKDLDKAAFRRFAVSSAPSASGAKNGGGGGGDAKRPSTATVQKSDKSRIMTLVSTQLQRDKSFSVAAGGGPIADTTHIEEMLDTLDLSNIQIPVGTRARYVPATDDPESFQVPVWSLRAMHKRQRERERFLIGNDPDFKKLGQAGREALRKRLARRSMFQQQEIIANAVVQAARAAVEPSVRKAEGQIHTGGGGALSRAGSMSVRGGNAFHGPGGGNTRRRASAISFFDNAPPPAATGDANGTAAATGAAFAAGIAGGGAASSPQRPRSGVASSDAQSAIERLARMTFGDEEGGPSASAASSSSSPETGSAPPPGASSSSSSPPPAMATGPGGAAAAAAPPPPTAEPKRQAEVPQQQQHFHHLHHRGLSPRSGDSGSSAGAGAAVAAVIRLEDELLPRSGSTCRRSLEGAAGSKGAASSRLSAEGLPHHHPHHAHHGLPTAASFTSSSDVVGAASASALKLPGQVLYDTDPPLPPLQSAPGPASPMRQAAAHQDTPRQLAAAAVEAAAC